MNNELLYRQTRPALPLSTFVESFWMLENTSDTDKEVVILPDGRVDLTFFRSAAVPFQVVLSGIETQPDQAILKAKTRMFAVSFKLLAVEYILHSGISDLLNYATYLPANFWGFSENDLDDFDLFCQKASLKIHALVPDEYDSRKQKLLDIVYATNGTVSIKDLSETVFWSSRQINRYFTQQFGLSLKAYCNILRFRASFHDIKQGKLFPQHSFADQSHFIKEVRKMAGVSPKKLKQNQNDRFIQFSMLPKK